MTNIEDIYTVNDYVITATLNAGGWADTNRHGGLAAAYVGRGAIRADTEGDLYAYAWGRAATLVAGLPHEREALVDDTFRHGRKEHEKSPAIAYQYGPPTMAGTGLLSRDIVGRLGNRERLAVDGLLIPPRDGRVSDPWQRGDRFGWVSADGNLAAQLSLTGRVVLLNRSLTGHWAARDVALLGPGANVRAECARVAVTAQLALAGKDWAQIDRALADGGYSPRRIPQ